MAESSVIKSWLEASDHDGKKEKILAGLVPWLQSRDTPEKHQASLLMSSEIVQVLFKTPVEMWKDVFDQALDIVYSNSLIFLPGDSTFIGRKECRHGEIWLRSQLLGKDDVDAEKLGRVMDVLLEASKSGVDDLAEACSEAVAKTFSLVARGFRDDELHELVLIQPANIAKLFGVSYDKEEIDRWCEENKQHLALETPAFDPAGHVLRKAIAHALRKHALTTTILASILKHVHTSVWEHLARVNMAHICLATIHPSCILGSGDASADDYGVLHKALDALGEALGPRGTQKPVGYYDASLNASCCKNNLEAVLTLLSQPWGVDPNEEWDSHGNNSLVWACRHANNAMVDLLLAAGANVNDCSRVGQTTALCWAAGYGRPLPCVRLLRSNADMDARDRSGRDATDLAGPPARFAYVASLSGPPTEDALTAEMLQEIKICRENSNKHKESGNAAFQKKNYRKAIDLYGKALLVLGHESPEMKSILYSNRAQCFINLCDFAKAQDEALKAIEQNKKNSKAAFRLKKAQDGLKK